MKNIKYTKIIEEESGKQKMKMAVKVSLLCLLFTFNIHIIFK